MSIMYPTAAEVRAALLALAEHPEAVMVADLNNARKLLVLAERFGVLAEPVRTATAPTASQAEPHLSPVEIYERRRADVAAAQGARR